MKSKKRYPAVHLILVLFGIIMVFPFIWMILSSFKSVGEQMTLPVKIFPSNFKNIDNYRQALQAVPFIKLYLNTFLMIAGRCICAVLFSSMAGYGFARFQFPGKNLLFTLVLVQMMVPSQVFIIPQYQMLSKHFCCVSNICHCQKSWKRRLCWMAAIHGKRLQKLCFRSHVPVFQHWVYLQRCLRGRI